MIPNLFSGSTKIAIADPLKTSGYVPGDVPDAQHWNWILYHLTEELVNILADKGITVDPTNDHQLRDALKFPIGTIIQFDANNAGGSGSPSGASGAWTDNVTIPGWYACVPANSVYGCPDMTNRFMMGKAVSGAGAAGGVATVTLAVANLPAHTHDFSGTTGNQSADHTHAIAGAGSAGIQGPYVNFGNVNGAVGEYSTLGESASHQHTFGGTTTSVGSATAFSIIPTNYSAIFIRRCA